MMAEASMPARAFLQVCALIGSTCSAFALTPAFLPAARSHASAFSLAQEARAWSTVCDDWPENWVDSHGRSCGDYSTEKLCLPSGDYGTGWQQEWGPFRNYGNAGATALGACCACGGGWSSYPATCSYIECPDGFMVKANSWNLYCKDVKCTLDADLWTCCDAHPDVQRAVKGVQDMTKQQSEVVRQKVQAAAENEENILRDATSARAKDLGENFTRETQVLQQERLIAAEGDFVSKTQHSDSVESAAEYQIRMSSYLSARDAPDGFVNTQQLEAKARQAVGGFAKAQDDWRQTDEASHHVVNTGKREWASYYKDLNATWPIITRGITTVNEALQESTVPGQVVRWSEQAVRLASDQAQITNTQLGSVDALVIQAEERASSALRATQTNMGRIADLEKMVDGMASGR